VTGRTGGQRSRRRSGVAAAAAYGSDPSAAPTELTIDQLAARAGLTVRNVRAYTTRGLLPPPRLRGRTGYYGPDHVARLSVITEMLDAIEQRREPSNSVRSALHVQRLIEAWLSDAAARA